MVTAPGAARKPKVEIVDYTPAHAEALSAFIRKVWDPDSTAASVAAGRAHLAARPGVVDGHLPTVLLLYNGEVVGHLTSLPERVSFAGASQPIAWLVGFHVLPEHRNGPIGMLVAKEMARLAPNSMCSMVLDAPLKLYTALGWKHLGTVPNLLRVIDGAALARRLDASRFSGGARIARPLRIAQRLGVAALGGAMASGAMRVWAATAPREAGLATAVARPEDWTGAAEADALWRQHAGAIPASIVRDGARVRTRFGGEPDRYVLVEARERGALVGWIILRRPRAAGDERLNGLKVAPIVDQMYPPGRPAVLGTLIRAAVAYCRATGFAEALVASTPNTAMLDVLRRSAFVPIPGTLQLVAHPSILPQPAPTFGSWWHARGDGDADESF